MTYGGFCPGCAGAAGLCPPLPFGVPIPTPGTFPAGVGAPTLSTGVAPTFAPLPVFPAPTITGFPAPFAAAPTLTPFTFPLPNVVPSVQGVPFCV